MSVSCGLVMVAAWVTAAMFGARLASGQEAKPAEGKDESQEGVSKRLLVEMRTLAERMQVAVGDGEKSEEAQLIEKPLYRFNDPARLYSDGSVWAWVTDGRPVVMTEYHLANPTKRFWAQDLVAIGDVRISAELPGNGRWTPRELDFKLLPVPEISAPAATDAARLRQMKGFARRLSASEVWEGQRYELRLLPTEVYRYSDAGSGLVDGAAFVFAFGNNPETILFVEAHKADSGPSAPGSWKYGLARMSAAAVTFRLGDTEVWSVPQTFGSSSTTYYTYTRRFPGADSPD
ncbi:MAG: hypothetical protein WD894_01380 [Pirellulales bacterium]